MKPFALLHSTYLPRFSSYDAPSEVVSIHPGGTDLNGHINISLLVAQGNIMRVVGQLDLTPVRTDDVDAGERLRRREGVVSPGRDAQDWLHCDALLLPLVLGPC